MEKNRHKKQAAIVYGLVLLYIAISIPIAYGISYVVGRSESMSQFFQYGRVGDLQYNLVPFANYVRAAQNGHLLGALGLLAGQLVRLTPIGIFIPMLQYKRKSYLRAILWGWLGLLAIQYVPKLLIRVGVVDIDHVILLFLGVSIGYWIWKRFVPKDEAFSRVVAVDS